MVFFNVMIVLGLAIYGFPLHGLFFSFLGKVLVAVIGMALT